jgi:Mn-dependent DtxR family transcriptional regulator
MKPLAQTHARAIVSLVQTHTGGRPMRWAGLAEIINRLTVKDPAVAAAAVQYAIDQGWVMVEGGHSICLTDEGRKLAQR